MFNQITNSGKSNAPDLKNVDFFVYYTAGIQFSKGDNPYSFGRDTQGNPIVGDYHYSPVFLPLFSLLARLDYDQARSLWLGLYALGFLATLVVVSRCMPSGWSFPFLVAGLALTLLSYPLLGHILTGQTDIFVSVLLLGSFLAYARKWKLLSAVLLAVGTVLKISPIFLLAYFVLFLRDFRYLLVYLTGLAAIVALSLFFVPLNLYSAYVFSVLPEVTKGTGMLLSQSLVSYFSFFPLLVRLISIGGLAALAALAWFLGNSFSPAGRQPALPLAGDLFRSEVVFMIIVNWVLIFHSGAWPYTYVWLILPSAWLLVGFIRQQVKPVYLALTVLGILLVMAKDYGIPVLAKLNLWGNMLLTSTLLFGLLKKDLIPLAPGTAQREST